MFALFAALFQRANDAVRAEAEARKEPTGMGTTLDIALLVRDRAFVAHTGDSRVYLARIVGRHPAHPRPRALRVARRRRARCATRRGPRSKRAAAAIRWSTPSASRQAVSVDTCFVELTRGDRLLLCSDGVHGEIESETCSAQLLRTGSAEDAANALVSLRLRRGGRDNATALVIEVCERFVARAAPDGEPTSGPGLERHPRGAPLRPARGSAHRRRCSPRSPPRSRSRSPKDERVPRLVASDWVCYIIVSGRSAADGRVLGPSGLLFVESLMGVAREGELPAVVENARLMRLRADDFAEVCAQDVELRTRSTSASRATSRACATRAASARAGARVTSTRRPEPA